MRLRYLCHYGRLTGYGRAARDYCAALQRVPGLDLEIVPLGSEQLTPEPRYQALDALVVPYDQLVGTADVAIYHTTPRVLATLPAQSVALADKRVALTTWETSALPVEHRQTLALYDAVIVPSEFCSAVMGEASPAIHVVPHCFDEEFWPVMHTSHTATSTYRFYSIGAWGERKNMLGLVRAYLSAFTKADRVELALFIDSCDFDEVRSVIARSGLRPDEVPAMSIPDRGPLSEYELVQLHVEGHCFVTATRGEGFGLGLFEAAIMGREIIAPVWGGHLDFLDDLGIRTRWVPHQMTPCFGYERRGAVPERDGERFQVAVSIAPGVNCKQNWADPDLVQLGRAMRAVYQSRPARSSEQLRGERAVLEARFGYRVVGPQLANILRGIAWPTHSST